MATGSHGEATSFSKVELEQTDECVSQSMAWRRRHVILYILMFGRFKLPSPLRRQSLVNAMWDLFDLKRNWDSALGV